MSRLLYEKSVCHQCHLIIPFILGMVETQPLYSYKLLSESGHKGKFHKAENPAIIYSSSLDEVIKVAKAHLDENADVVRSLDLFKSRYTYRDNLIIIATIAGKYFYDHYPPNDLKNIAAPRLFQTEQDCINWVKEGLDRSHTNQSVQ